eukprot:gene36126-40862_t
MNHLVEGPLRDPASLNKPSTSPLPELYRIGEIPGIGVHWGLAAGIIACILFWVLIEKTTFGFAARIVGGNLRAAQVQGLPAGLLMIGFTALGGSLAGLAGAFEVAAVHGSANASLAGGYGYTGILIAFLARHNCLAIIPATLLFAGFEASSGLVQRRLDLPDATIVVFQGMIFIAILLSDAFRQARMTDIGLWGVPLAILGGAIRVSTPFIFVSIGECLTERSGRINLGLEGTLVFGAMSGYAVAYHTGSAWAGTLAAAVCGLLFGLLHGWICKFPKVNDIAI